MQLIFLNFWHCQRHECSFLPALDSTTKMKPPLINSSIKQTLNSFPRLLKCLVLKNKSPQRFSKLHSSVTKTRLPENGRNTTVSNSLCAVLLIIFGVTQLCPSSPGLSWQHTTSSSNQGSGILYNLITQVFVPAKVMISQKGVQKTNVGT